MATPVNPLEKVNSVQQDEWEAIADLLRGHVARIALNEKLTPEEVCWLANLADKVIHFERCARSYDHELELWMSRFTLG